MRVTAQRSRRTAGRGPDARLLVWVCRGTRNHGLTPWSSVRTKRVRVHFDYGLDEGPGTTLVSLLEHEVFLRLWSEYRPDCRVFGTPELITVAGRG